MFSPRVAPARILIVEDSTIDTRLMREALKVLAFAGQADFVEDGQRCLDFLRGCPPRSDWNQPDLVLLDLYLPKKSGHEVLAELNADPSLRLIPVAVFTRSLAERDILASYELRASCYVAKPDNFGQLMEVMKGLLDWVTVLKSSAGHEVARPIRGRLRARRRAQPPLISISSKGTAARNLERTG